MSVVIETTLGDISVDLYLNERPRACLNFLKLCKIKYYNYNLFHTISRGFIAQTGDPTGSRSGGESLYGVLDGPEKRYFEGENEPRIKHTKMGLISFVGNEERMIGSQFFLTLGEELTYLDQKHCVFGEVVEGLDILEDINEVICDTDDRPYQDVRITHTVVLDDPYPDPRRLVVPSRSPSPSAERLQGGRIAPDEDIDETEGKNAEEVAEIQADREAKARATILEMVGDLPDAEMAPPENVLFVCKLNPVTTDDDLEIIFNRFGKIVSCEVIRDRKTKDSLQYAFIEFADRKSCEDAYFKMDNILIDDRRIHVDFSQSVSKVKWLGKGRGVTHFDEKGRKTAVKHNDIGAGNYKLNDDGLNTQKNGNKSSTKRNNSYRGTRYKTESSNSRGRSRSRERRDRSRSPNRDSRKQNNSRRDNGRNNSDNYRFQRQHEDNYNRSNRRDRRNRSRSRSLTKRIEDRRNNNNNRDRYDRRNEPSRRRYDESSNRRNWSRNSDRRNDNSYYSRYNRNGSSSSKYSDFKNGSDSYRNNDDVRSEDSKRKSKELQEKSKTLYNKKKKSETESNSSDSEIEKRKRNKKKTKSTSNDEEKSKAKKKKRKPSTETETSSESETDSSNSEEEKVKSKKKKKGSSDKSDKKKRIKRKKSTESDSSDTSDSSESETSSESESEKKKNKKNKKVSKESSSSDSSESDAGKKKKQKR